MTTSLGGWLISWQYSLITLNRLGGADIIDFLFSGEPSIWKGELPSEWDCGQLQLFANRFSHSFDYEHFSQFPCALEFLSREKFVNIRECFKKTPVYLARAKLLAKSFPHTAKDQ